MTPRGATAPAGRDRAHQLLTDLVAERSIIICSGSGGVGKTTTAAVLAMEAARLGRRAVVVTIDPAKRLADALGLGDLGIGNEPQKIEGGWPGELSAVMLDGGPLRGRHACQGRRASTHVTGRVGTRTPAWLPAAGAGVPRPRARPRRLPCPGHAPGRGGCRARAGLTAS